MFRALTKTLLVGAVIVTFGCGGAAEEPAAPRSDRAASVAMLEGPAGPASGQPRLHEGADGRLYLSWIEERGDAHALLFATLKEDSWSTPRTIVTGDDWFVNWADVPSICALESGALAAHWLQRMGEGTYAYGIRIATSVDGGETWSGPRWLHEDKTPTEHGFASLYPLDADRFGAVWLDGRALEARREMELRARSFDARGGSGEESVLDARVCECCATTVGADGQGGAFVAYRDRSADDIRDIYGVRSEGAAWGKPKLCHDDGWEMPG